MVRAMSAFAVLLLSLTMLGGCPDGNGQGAVEPHGGGTGSADAGFPPLDTGPVEPPPPPVPTEYSGEPGTLEVTATFNGEAIESPIEVRRTGQEAVEATATVNAGNTTASFSLPPGRYDVKAGFPRAIDGMADLREGIRIESGRTKKIDFTFDSLSQVTLECKRGSQRASGTIRLRRPGATDYLSEIRCQQEFFITGGAWEAEVTIGGGRGGIVIQTTLQIVGGGVVRTPIMIEAGGRGR